MALQTSPSCNSSPTVGESGTPQVRLNIGCGHIQPAGWINIDNSIRASLASRLPILDRLLTRLKLLPMTEFNRYTRVINVHKKLPWPDKSVDAIYCGEVLEHFDVKQGEQFIRECFRILRPDGVLRVRVPDNYRFWKSYTREYETAIALNHDQWTDRHTRWIAMFFKDICVRRPYFGSMGHFHKWMYDEISLTLLFRNAGFLGVERRAFHDSRIHDVSAVEARDDLIIEAVK